MSPQKRRKPHPAWFALPALMIVGGAAAAIIGFVTALAPLTTAYGVVPAGETSSVAIDEPGTVLLYRDATPDVTCEVTSADGEPIETSGPGGTYTYTESTQEWTGFASFESDGSDVDLACDAGGSAAEVRVGPRPALAGALVGVFSGIGVAGLGFLGLIVLAILYATGAPRRTTATG